MSSLSGLWRDSKLPGSSRSLRQACLCGRMPFSSIMARVQAFNRVFFRTHQGTGHSISRGGNLLESRSHHYRHQRICQIMLPAVSWVHLEKEISSMPILWRIACRLPHSHSMPGADESEYPLKPRNHEEFDTR